MQDNGDTRLALQAAAGDRQAFGQLLSRHYDLIFRAAFRFLGSRAEAEDLAQDVCAALPAKLRGFRGEAKVTTWLYRVVLNAARDQMRRRSARDRAAAGWGSVEVLHREAGRERQAELDWLAHALGGLSGDLRETVALVLGEEMSHAEAAGVLGLSEGTVSWRMSEVRKALRAQADKEMRLG